MRLLFLSAAILAGILLQAASPGYSVGEDLLVNGKLANPRQGVPEGWEKLILRLGKGKAVVKPDDGGMLLYFTSPEHMDQVRIKQTVRLEPGKVYEFRFEYRSELNASLQADASLLGTGLFLRSWKPRPTKEWTPVRGLFHLPPTVPEKGSVIVLLQNRSMPKLWYRNISLREAKVAPEEVAKLIPQLKVHSVTSDDIFILPGTRAESANFLINDLPDEQLKHFRFEAELWPSDTVRVPCSVKDIRIAVPMARIPVGKSKLITRMFDRSDNAMVQSTVVTIERIGEIPADVDFSRVVTLKTPAGKPIFPIGVYAGTGWEFKFTELADLGFNVIHSYGTGNPAVLEEYNPQRYKPEYLKNNRRLLADAEKRGIYIMMSVPHQLAENPERYPLLKEWQALYSDSPAVIAWYVDEMRSIRNTPFALIKKSYDLIKAGDPKHREWWGYENPEPELANSLDSIMLGVTSEAVVKLIKLKLGSDKGIIHVYGQRDFRNSVASSLEYNQYNFVLPVIWGARGIFYFTWRNVSEAKTNPEYKELRPRVANTVKRFSAIAPSILSEEPAPEWAARLRTTGMMEYKVFTEKGVSYLFCGVGMNATGGGTIELPAGKQLRDVLNDRPLAESKLELQPGQGRIIEVK